MKLSIDTVACTGHGRCFVLAPDVYDSDDDGYSRPRFTDVPPELEEEARKGAANCPERAITLSD